jgi:hypothetical protein
MNEIFPVSAVCVHMASTAVCALTAKNRKVVTFCAVSEN